MSGSWDGGKGDGDHVTDHEKYGRHYDDIYRKCCKTCEHQGGPCHPDSPVSCLHWRKKEVIDA